MIATIWSGVVFKFTEFYTANFLSCTVIPFYLALNLSRLRADLSFLIFLLHTYTIVYAIIHNNIEKNIMPKAVDRYMLDEM